MPKKSGTGKPDMELISPPSPSFYKAQPKAEPAPAQKAQVVSGTDLIDAMRAQGTDWDERLAKLVNAPASLHKRSVDGMTQYSKSGRFEIDSILSGLALHRVGAGLTDFGAAFYSTQGSVYFVFADMERRVIVKERVFCIHETPPEKSWRSVAGHIEAALSYAQSDELRKNGLVAVYDQMLSAVKPL